MMNSDYLWQYLAHRDLLNTLDLVSVSYTPVSLKPRSLQYLSIICNAKPVEHSQKRKNIKTKIRLIYLKGKKFVFDGSKNSNRTDHSLIERLF